jgi:hypothetical protein
MHVFTATVRKFASKGEKTGWTYVDIPPDLLKKLKLTDKKSFRIKGSIDDVKIEKLSTYPIGEGQFIIALNTQLKKQLGKKEGAIVSVRFDVDNRKAPKSKELFDALNEEPEAMSQFNSLLLSHQNYFHRYVFSAKGADTKAGRIVHVINAMYRKQDFGQMIRSLKKNNPGR